jgi:hypothetical protein
MTEHALEFDGKPVAAWIVPRLDFARRHGWRGRVLSGYRTPAAQKAAGRRYAAALRKPIEQVYPSGVLASNHCRTLWPGGAVDVTEPERLDIAMTLWKMRGHGRPLVWGGPVIGDFAHFSHDGH